MGEVPYQRERKRALVRGSHKGARLVPLCEHITMTVTRSMALSLLGILMLTAALIFLVPDQTLAGDETASATQTISTGLGATAKTTGYSTDLKLPEFIGNMIRTLLAATGIIFLIITVYAGILYMTAAGETEKIKKAKGMLTSSVIGLVIIVGAYAITYYVVQALIKSTDATETAGST